MGLGGRELAPGGAGPGAAGSWGQVGEGARQLGGSKACAQPRWRRHRALPKVLPRAAGPSMQAENPPPRGPAFLPRPSSSPASPRLPAHSPLAQAVLAQRCRLVPFIPPPHCDLSPLMSQSASQARPPASPGLRPHPGSATRTCPGVLGKAGLEFLFFTGACVVLYFGFLTICLPVAIS